MLRARVCAYKRYMTQSQLIPSHQAPAADAPGKNPRDAESIERELRHIYPQKNHVDMRHIGYTHIDDVLGGLEAGMSCSEIEDATGIGHNHVRAILRGEYLKWQGDDRVPMTGKQRAWASRIRMMKHHKQIKSIGEPIRRHRRTQNPRYTQDAPKAAPAVDPKDSAAAIAEMYEDRLAELENENKRMREQLVEMHIKLMS